MKKTILFFTIIAVSVFSADRIFAYVLGKLYSTNLKGMSGGDINYYLAYNKVDMLAIGSSRCRKHLIPDSMETSSFNLSHNGMDIGFHAALTDILDSKGRLPSKFLLVHIETNSIFRKDDAINNDIQYLRVYYSSNGYVKAQIDQSAPFEFIKYGLDSYRFNGAIPSILKNSWASSGHVNLYKGFEGKEANLQDSLNTVYSFNLAKKVKEVMKIDYAINNPGWLYLKHIQGICKKNKIGLVCYTSPYYGNNWDNESGRKTKQMLVKEGIIYINFSEVEIPSLASPCLWEDYAHLNSKGAGIFSAMLNDSLKAKGLY